MKKESTIERAVVQYAQSFGILAPKFSPMGSSGWPDRIFLYRGHTMFIEFKRPGQQLRAVQFLRKSQLEQQGFTCHSCDDMPMGRRLVETFMKRVEDTNILCIH